MHTFGMRGNKFHRPFLQTTLNHAVHKYSTCPRVCQQISSEPRLHIMTIYCSMPTAKVSVQDLKNKNLQNNGESDKSFPFDVETFTSDMKHIAMLFLNFPSRQCCHDMVHGIYSWWWSRLSRDTAIEMSQSFRFQFSPSFLCFALCCLFLCFCHHIATVLLHYSFNKTCNRVPCSVVFVLLYV